VPSDTNSRRRGIVGVFCSCPTWYSVPVGKSSRVFLAGAAGINWPKTNRLVHPAGEATMSSRLSAENPFRSPAADLRHPRVSV